MWHITWDPTEETATRPLAIRKDGTWYCYGWDHTKNICEVFKSDGYIGTSYTYTPYGAVTPAGTVIQPIQWSSEFFDTELRLTYYNYRYYNYNNGKWLNRDLYNRLYLHNLYDYYSNSPIIASDIIGCAPIIVMSDKLFDNPSESVIYSYIALNYSYKIAIERIESLNNEEFSKLQKDNKILWNSTIFTKSKSNLIELIRRECEYINKVSVVSKGGWKNTKKELLRLIPFANQKYDAIYLITHGDDKFYFQLGNDKSESFDFNVIQKDFDNITNNSPAEIKKIMACYYNVPYKINVKLTANIEIDINNENCVESIDITPIRAKIIPGYYTLPPTEIYP